MKAALFWALGFGGLASSVGAFQEPAPDPGPFSAEVDAWRASPSGWMFITRGSQPGSATRAREGNQIGLGSQVLPIGEARWRFWDSSAVEFRAVPLEETGTHAASSDFIYHGTPFAAGREIRSSVGFLLLDLEVEHAWRLSEDLTFTPKAGAEYWGFSSELKTEDALPPLDEKRSFSSGYWLAGAEFEEELGSALRARVSLTGGLTGTERYFFEVEGGLVLALAPHLSLTADYRARSVRFHTSTNQANFLFFGPSVGAELRF